MGGSCKVVHCVLIYQTGFHDALVYKATPWSCPAWGSRAAHVCSFSPPASLCGHLSVGVLTHTVRVPYNFSWVQFCLYMELKPHVGYHGPQFNVCSVVLWSLAPA